MAISLTISAKDRSTYIVDIEFRDETDTLVVPTSATWTLSNGDGDIVNLREDVAISPIAASVIIALSAEDTAYANGRVRYLKVHAIYDSPTAGNNLPIIDEAIFQIDDTQQVA